MYKITKPCIIIALALSTVSFSAFGTGVKNSGSKKTVAQKLKKGSVSFGLQNAAISMPTKLINGTPHFGIEVGYSAPIKENNKKPRLMVGADLGYYNQQGLQCVSYIKPNISYNFYIGKKFSIQPRIGLGYALTSNANSEFKKVGDEYKKVSPLNSQMLTSFGVQPKMNVYKSKKFSYDAYLRYEFAAQTPFSIISKMLPTTIMNFGVVVKKD